MHATEMKHKSCIVSKYPRHSGKMLGAVGLRLLAFKDVRLPTTSFRAELIAVLPGYNAHIQHLLFIDMFFLFWAAIACILDKLDENLQRIMAMKV